jgi:hypothetical protein
MKINYLLFFSRGYLNILLLLQRVLFRATSRIMLMGFSTDFTVGEEITPTVARFFQRASYIGKSPIYFL